jgi:hypothetical protein
MASPVGAPREATNAPVPKAGGGGRAFLGRFVLAHFVAYPIAIVAAIGATPLALWVRERSILEAGATGARWTTVTEALAKHRVTATEAAQVQIVLDFVIIMTVATFALVHLAALPWAVEGARTRTRTTATRQMRTAGFRVFVGITAATLVLVALSGMAGWAWLLLQ